MPGYPPAGGRLPRGNHSRSGPQRLVVKWYQGLGAGSALKCVRHREWRLEELGRIERRSREGKPRDCCDQPPKHSCFDWRPDASAFRTIVLARSKRDLTAPTAMFRTHAVSAVLRFLTSCRKSTSRYVAERACTARRSVSPSLFL